MMELYNIFSTIAAKLFHYGQKSNFILQTTLSITSTDCHLGYTNTDDKWKPDSTNF